MSLRPLTSPHPPKHYFNLVDDGFFKNESHARTFLTHINSLTSDLQYTLELPSHKSSLPYLDILIHSDNSTSIYRKPTHTNVYTHYNSCSPQVHKDSIIRSLTRRAYTLCSHKHLQPELEFLKKHLPWQWLPSQPHPSHHGPNPSLHWQIQNSQS